MNTTVDNLRQTCRRLRRAGFTLVELLVVASIIALTLGMVVPSIRAVFAAKTDRYAAGVLGGMLSSARGVAIENQNYSLLHVQIGGDDQCWAGVMRRDNSTGRFVPGHFVCPKHQYVRRITSGTCPECNSGLIWSGLLPRLVQKGIAFGEVTSRDPAYEPTDNRFQYVSGQEYQSTLNDLNGWAGFTTFNVIFDPDGALVTEVDGAAPQLDTGHTIFTGVGGLQIWNPTAACINETGVRVITVFDYKTAKLKTDRAGYFNAKDSSGEFLRGQFLAINPYTGQLINTE